MALYLGNDSIKKLKIFLDGTVYKLVIPSNISVPVRLLTSDGYILKDSNGIILKAKGIE